VQTIPLGQEYQVFSYLRFRVIEYYRGFGLAASARSGAEMLPSDRIQVSTPKRLDRLFKFASTPMHGHNRDIMPLNLSLTRNGGEVRHALQGMRASKHESGP
jgi:hypothetical protein